MEPVPKKALSLLDCTCIIVGIIIGVGIYETSPTVAACMGGWKATVAIWLAGGFVVLCGALCYAELASAYPRQGGDMIYLSRAYGPWAGFLFGWSQMAVIRPTDIALMAYIFARYASTLYAPFAHSMRIYAAGAIAVLTLINLLGVRESRWTQNLLTIIKVAAVVFIAVVGWLSPGGASVASIDSVSVSGVKLGMILVLYTYGGWHELSYVAGEIRNPRKNILRALLLGTITVALLYLLINGAFLRALGYPAMAASQSVASDAVGQAFPSVAGRLIAVVICVSALGTLNGMVFTGARITYALGQAHPMFERLGRWHPRLGTPVVALLMQGTIGLVIVLLAGSFIDTILYSAPAVWLFFLGTATSLFVLRRKDPECERPFRVVGYPIIPTVFFLSCLFMLYGSVSYAFAQRPLGLVVMFVVMAFGVVLSQRK